MSQHLSNAASTWRRAKSFLLAFIDAMDMSEAEWQSKQLSALEERLLRLEREILSDPAR